jgi:hypothetical protein
MNKTGPVLETLTRRLAETPPDFLAEPVVAGAGSVHVPALVNDLAAMHGGRLPQATLAAFVGTAAHVDRNRLALVMIAVWLLADDWFLGQGIAPAVLADLLTDPMAELAVGTPAHKFVNDPERREELARVILAFLDYRPQGESEAQATDRLAAVSATARRKLLAASRAAEQRARQIREALAKKAAEESADKWTRE